MRVKSSENTNRVRRKSKEAASSSGVFGNGNVEADRALNRALKLAGIDRCSNVTQQRNQPQTPQTVKKELDAAWHGAKTPRTARAESSPTRPPSRAQTPLVQTVIPTPKEHALCSYEGQLVDNLAARALARAIQGPLSARAIIEVDKSTHDALRQWQLHVHRSQVRDTPKIPPQSPSTFVAPSTKLAATPQPQPNVMAPHAELRHSSEGMEAMEDCSANLTGGRLGLKARLLDELQFSRELANNEEDRFGVMPEESTGRKSPDLQYDNSQSPNQHPCDMPQFSTGPLNGKLSRLRK